MKKSFLLLTVLPLFSFAQPSAFDISGTVKTVETSDDRKIDLPRGDVKIEEDSKILEINLRRTNPTVSGDVTVKWVVLIKDLRDRLKVITKGEQRIQVDVGIPTKLESDAFSLKSADFDFRRGGDNKMEQEVEGYAVLILDQQGKELGSRFQPKSVETQVREGLEKGGQDAPQTPNVPKEGRPPKRDKKR